MDVPPEGSMVDVSPPILVQLIHLVDCVLKLVGVKLPDLAFLCRSTPWTLFDRLLVPVVRPPTENGVCNPVNIWNVMKYVLHDRKRLYMK